MTDGKTSKEYTEIWGINDLIKTTCEFSQHSGLLLRQKLIFLPTKNVVFLEINKKMFFLNNLSKLQPSDQMHFLKLSPRGQEWARG